GFARRVALDEIVSLSPSDVDLAGQYLVLELMAEHPRFCLAAAAARLRESLRQDLELRGVRSAFEDDLRAASGPGAHGEARERDGAPGVDPAVARVERGLRQRLALARAWLDA